MLLGRDPDPPALALGTGLRPGAGAAGAPGAIWTSAPRFSHALLGQLGPPEPAPSATWSPRPCPGPLSTGGLARAGYEVQGPGLLSGPQQLSSCRLPSPPRFPPDLGSPHRRSSPGHTSQRWVGHNESWEQEEVGHNQSVSLRSRESKSDLTASMT